MTMSYIDYYYLLFNQFDYGNLKRWKPNSHVTSVIYCPESLSLGMNHRFFLYMLVLVQCTYTGVIITKLG